MTNDALEQDLDDVKRLIEGGEFEGVLDRLRGLTLAAAPDLGDEVILHTARFNGLRRDHRKGLMTDDAFAAGQARLRVALLELLKELPRRAKSKDAPIPAGSAEAAPAPGAGAFENVHGVNNLKQFAWLERGRRAGRAVCKVHAPAGGGTGFLVGPNLLMTCNHVLSHADAAERTFIEFNYQDEEPGGAADSVRYRLDPSVFHTSPHHKLDYTLVGVAPHPDRPPLETWGHLRLNANADPVPGENIVLIGHPGGMPKQVVLTGSRVTEVSGHTLRYTTDTLRGSSGSPVFNDLWQVVAIHNWGDDRKVRGRDGKSCHVNSGILMSAIRKDAGELWPKAD